MDSRPTKKGPPTTQLRSRDAATLVRMAVALTRAELGTVAAELERALRPIGLTLGAHVASVCSIGDGVQRARHEWRSTGWMTHEPLSIDCTAAPWWCEQLASARDIVIDDVHDLPETAAEERRLLDARGTRAVVALPLVQRTHVHGHTPWYVVIERPGRTVECATAGRFAWTHADLEFASAAVELMSAALEREADHQRALAEARGDR